MAAASSIGVSPDLQDTFVVRQIRRCNRNLLLVNGGVLAVILVIGGSQWKYFDNFFFGPFAIDRQTLVAARATEPLAKYFVSLNPDELVATGVRDVERETGASGTTSRQTVRADYYVARLNQKLMLVRTVPGAVGQQLAGRIVPTNGDALDAILAPLEKSQPDLRGRFLPVMLDATDFRQPGYVALLFGVPLLLVAVWNIGKGLRRNGNLELHPSAVKLAANGPLAETIRRIEDEIKSGAERVGSIIVTRSWVLAPDLYRLHSCSLDNLVWAHKRTTQYAINFAPAFKASGIILWERNKKQIPILCLGERADQLLHLIALRAPWAFFGYTKELVNSAKRNWSDIVAAVDQRRTEAGRMKAEG